jgi:preprotein translocase subunit SecA
MPTESAAPPPQNQKSKSKYSKKKGRKGKTVSLRNSTLIMDNMDQAQELFEDELYKAVNQQAVERLIGAIARRLPEELSLDPEQLSELEWEDIEEQIVAEINEIYNKRRARFNYDERLGGLVERLENLFRYDLFVETTSRELKQVFSSPALPEIKSIDQTAWRSIGNQVNIFIDRKKIAADPAINLLGENQTLLAEALSELDPGAYNLSSADWETVKSAIKDHLAAFYDKWLVVQIISALRLMSQERKTVFSKGKKATQTSNWFSYRHYAARSLESKQPGEIKEAVLAHLLGAHQARTGVYGVKVWSKLSPDWSISDLPDLVHTYLKEELDSPTYQAYEQAFIRDIRPGDQDIFIRQIGRYELSEYYREIFLRVISSLWVEYITEMEALRVKIGLEAYAQRDPLVAYKTQASEMFQVLFSNMQRDVVSRMFKSRGIFKGEKEERLAMILKVREARKDHLSETQSEAALASQGA